MTATYLASGDGAVQAGYLAAMFGLPTVGLILLAVGLRERSRRRPSGSVAYRPPSGYSAGPGYPFVPGPAQPVGLYPGYPAGLPGPPRAGSSATALIVVGALVLTLGIGLGIRLGTLARLTAAASRTAEGSQHTYGQSSPSGLAPSLLIGQCISEFSFRTGGLTSAAADCDDPGSAYELAAEVGPTATCPDGKRDSSVYDRLANESLTLCFVLNLKQGQCYMRMEGGPAETLTPIDCADTRFAQVSVAQRVDGSIDTTQCPAGVRAVAYPAPARLYCLLQTGA